jgi:outer membrane protein assembly factor BamE (lipoprotein component of BamABCDE complex)
MLRKLIFGSLIFISAGSLLTGCVTTLGHQIDQSAYSQIHKGVSTKEDVVELLGSPNQEVENEDGTSTFIYSFTKVSSGIYGIGSGVDTQSATIKFDSKGIVISKSKQIGDTGGTGIGGGGVK